MKNLRSKEGEKMASQGTLFRLFDPDVPPVRRDDPATSQVAALHVLEKIGERQAFALAAVRQYPGKTAAEIEAAIQCRDGRVRKRLKELVRGGLVDELASRVCEVTGHKATTYRVREKSA
jgi:hypothetical protein